MAEVKKTTEKVEKVEEVKEPLIYKVLDRKTLQILKVDVNKEKDYKTKYLHIS
jgi:hypothetical protein